VNIFTVPLKMLVLILEIDWTVEPFDADQGESCLC
jgi:hypothetical protein